MGGTLSSGNREGKMGFVIKRLEIMREQIMKHRRTVVLMEGRKWIRIQLCLMEDRFLHGKTK